MPCYAWMQGRGEPLWFCRSPYSASRTRCSILRPHAPQPWEEHA